MLIMYVFICLVNCRLIVGIQHAEIARKLHACARKNTTGHRMSYHLVYRMVAALNEVVWARFFNVNITQKRNALVASSSRWLKCLV